MIGIELSMTPQSWMHCVRGLGLKKCVSRDIGDPAAVVVSYLTCGMRSDEPASGAFKICRIEFKLDRAIALAGVA